MRVACRCGEKAVESGPSDTQTPLVVQENHYDPFGLDLTGLNVQPGLTASRFKYIDRELQADLGWYDLQARFYDPGNGRFTTVDPVTEEQENFSPYHYSFDNPIRFSDPNGKCPDCPDEDPSTAFLVSGAVLNTVRDVAVSAVNVSYMIFGNSTRVVAGEKLMDFHLETQKSANGDLGQWVRNGLSDVLDVINVAASVGTGGSGGAGVLLAKTGKAVMTTAATRVAKYEVGTFDDLVRRSAVGDGLQIHHVPQKQPASQIILGYDKKTDPSIAIPNAEHKSIPTMRGENTAGTPRQQLAKDIRDLRRKSQAPNSSLEQLIDLTKKNVSKFIYKINT